MQAWDTFGTLLSRGVFLPHFRLSVLLRKRGQNLFRILRLRQPFRFRPASYLILSIVAHFINIPLSAQSRPYNRERLRQPKTRFADLEMHQMRD